jgi:Protein kinase domain
MPLSPATRLGPYEILALLGAGGMGEVYKARDTRLDRIVAIKVSNEQFSERFEREAHAVASLNHSHVCTLHDIGPNYLVMEYVEGAGGRWQISSIGGRAPIFCRNGRELFFYNLPEDRIMVASYSVKGGSFVAEKPRVWSEISLAALSASTGATQYDVASDGKRLAAATYAGGGTQQNSGHVIFLENFSDELQRKVPVGDK